MRSEDQEIRQDTRIVINGQEYRSLDEVPEPYRDLLRDEDKDGTPAVLQAATSQQMQVTRIVRDGRTTYTYNGQQFERIEDLPAQAQKFFEAQAAPGAAPLQADSAHPVQPAAQRPEPPGERVPPARAAGSSRLVVVIAATLATVLVVALIGWLAGWF
jgi:hypothetical protein